MVKTRDRLSRWITFSGRVVKPLTPPDRELFARGSREAAEIVRAAAPHLFRAGYFAIRPGGTAKIGEAVDSNLQTRIRGLYVCGASIIPSPWATRRPSPCSPQAGRFRMRWSMPGSGQTRARISSSRARPPPWSQERYSVCGPPWFPARAGCEPSS